MDELLVLLLISRFNTRVTMNISKQESSWFVYLLRCHDNSLYCGVTTDVVRREQEHNHGNKGAKYTRVRRPVSLVYVEAANNRSEACQHEARLKKLSKLKKEALISSEQNIIESAIQVVER